MSVGEHDSQRVLELGPVRRRLPRPVQAVALEPSLVGGVALKVVSRRGQGRADRSPLQEPPDLEVLHGGKAAGKPPVREPPLKHVPKAQPGRIEPEVFESRLRLPGDGRDPQARAHETRENRSRNLHDSPLGIPQHAVRDDVERRWRSIASRLGRPSGSPAVSDLEPARGRAYLTKEWLTRSLGVNAPWSCPDAAAMAIAFSIILYRAPGFRGVPKNLVFDSWS